MSDKIMSKGYPGKPVFSAIEHALSASPDYWERTSHLGMDMSPDGFLPEFRTLPECPEAMEVVAAGEEAWQQLLAIVQHECEATPSFKNALFLLLYFDNLFMYRELKALYAQADASQRPWLEAVCRKIVFRCLEVPEDTQEVLTREIVRNTWRGRLATTGMMMHLAEQLFAKTHAPITLRDMAVSDGGTTLDLAEEAARRGVPVSITASDVRVYLAFAKHHGHAIVCYSNHEPIQYLIEGKTYGLRHAEVPVAFASVQRDLHEAVKDASPTITMLSPQVDEAVRTERYAISFKEEDAFHPEADIKQADIIRIANLLVERTEEHRGYYYRRDILHAIAELGAMAKDGAYLYLDNFRNKIEYIGFWQKRVSAGAWVRLPITEDVAADLEGVTTIPIAAAMNR